MNLHKSKIEWCTHTWNPVTGCFHDCQKTYCYACRQVARFQPHACESPMMQFGVNGIIEQPGRNDEKCYMLMHPIKLADETGQYVRSTPYPKGFAPTLAAYTMEYPKRRYIPSRVFVSSMGDLFGDWVPDDWIQWVFKSCMKAPQHTYLFLTKNPDRYVELANAGMLPNGPNFWYGTTITGPDMPVWGNGVHNAFISIEPLHAPFNDMTPFHLNNIRWVIIGAQTGAGARQHQPRREWVENIVECCAAAKVPVFQKNNLRDVWGKKLIQQYPAGMIKKEAR